MSALPEPSRVPETSGVDTERFHGEIRPGLRPVVMRGLVADWPAVEAARQGDRAIVDYLLAERPTRGVATLRAPPECEGRLFYNQRLTGFNFVKEARQLSDFLTELLALADEPDAPAIAVQSEPIPSLMPRVAEANRLDLLPEVEPRIWIGNRLRVGAHFDLQENVACNIAGRRRFTLFPPEQIANLYVGPVDLTPAGTPVSMVDLARPDLAAHPRYAEALAHAQVAELEPGDALYIPYGWWHAVESREAVSILVNYWWTDTEEMPAGPYDAMLHAVAAFRHLPPEQRRVWQGILGHFVFQQDGNGADHLPPHARGILADPSPAQFSRLKQLVKQILR